MTRCLCGRCGAGCHGRTAIAAGAGSRSPCLRAVFRAVCGAGHGVSGWAGYRGRAGRGPGTPSWQLSIFPEVPVYCRCTPAERVPFLMKPVSSTASTPSSAPRCSSTKPRTSSRTASAGQPAWFSSRCMPSGHSSPACSASVPVLALQRREQSAQVLSCPPTRLRPPEMLTDPSMQSVQTRRPAVHLINCDVPTHAQFNEQPDHSSHQLRLQY